MEIIPVVLFLVNFLEKYIQPGVYSLITKPSIDVREHTYSQTCFLFLVVASTSTCSLYLGLEIVTNLVPHNASQKMKFTECSSYDQPHAFTDGPVPELLLIMHKLVK